MLLHSAPCSVLVARRRRRSRSILGRSSSASTGRRSPRSQRRSPSGSGHGSGSRSGRSRPGAESFDLAAVNRIATGVRVVEGAPVDALVGAVEAEDLLVVGSRGLHGAAPSAASASAWPTRRPARCSSSGAGAREQPRARRGSSRRSPPAASFISPPSPGPVTRSGPWRPRSSSSRSPGRSGRASSAATSASTRSPWSPWRPRSSSASTSPERSSGSCWRAETRSRTTRPAVPAASCARWLRGAPRSRTGVRRRGRGGARGELAVGDRVVVRAGEVVPVDGIVASAEAVSTSRPSRASRCRSRPGSARRCAAARRMQARPSS